MDRVDAIVIGAGVVGLAAARALALSNRDTLIIDGEPQFGSWTSSRNSEVIHAGIYYPPGSLKASLCIEGRDRLYAYCQARSVPFQQLGKLIFAKDASQTAALDVIERTARDAGAGEIHRLSAQEARRIEPALIATEALFSPRTGIVDSHGLMQTMLGEAEAHGAILACNTRVSHVDRIADRWRIYIEGESDAVVETPILINAAGLGAQKLARQIESLPASHIPPLFLARGVYFTYSGRTPFRHLIYPVPEPGGLGTHLTLDMAGQARFGPDVEWIDAVDYSVDPGRHAKFAAAAARIWPALDPDRLQPGYAGIRPKLSGPGAPAADFVISGPAAHGQPGLVNLFGIESPGLTASLAIAERILEQIQ